MTDKAKFIEKARAVGFERVVFAPVLPFEGWREQADKLVTPPKLSDDPHALLEGAKSIIVLMFPYKHLLNSKGAPAVSGYYVASNASYLAMKSLLDEYPGFVKARLPAKRAAERVLLGSRGWNGLIGADGLGTRFAIQLLLSDTFEPDAPERNQNVCTACGRCAKACPANAISDGKLDSNRCIRTYMGGGVMPEFVKNALVSLLGCEICQKVCPRNDGVGCAEQDEAMARAFSFESLLAGDICAAQQYVGTNVSAARLVAQAVILAAKSGGYEKEIGALSDSEHESVRDAVEWAKASFR